MRQAACDRYSAAASTDLKRPMSPHARTDADRAHNPACSILRQRQIPRSSRRRPPEAPAGARESPQRQDRRARSCRESPPIPAQPNRRDQPATPEIAGSSPVAPVFEAPASRPVLRTRERPSRPCDRPRRELVVMTSRTAGGQRAGPPWRDSLTSPLDVVCTSASRSPHPVCTSARGRRGSAGKSARRSSDLREPRAARYDVDAGGARIGQLDRTTRRERGATP
jgi:hypothetical protein